MIRVKLDVTKVDKSKLFIGKNGAKYLDVILIETPNNQYGDDYMAVQEASKEERLAGKRGAILGNAKILKKPTEQSPTPPPIEQPPAQPDDEVPF